ncbi:protein tyrosine phosphatase domain-containing protein 1 isoform X8 [Ornithorhynchus anatinus]|uniref:protein tyrosine phosphatase domain-containing protein 1 isoform X8 n=1 Tax=Ornithorhynchus anatinus TaxID=9258 RepID=UPI0004541ADB|nr:protein tyrosine phosphatase domain-containing protein 1 isoform X8 [Ornithorhynchus anatinus]
MQGSPRKLSAVNFLSTFFQGRRHSTSDPLLRLYQRRRSSVIEVLSSSSHRVMVAVSSVSSAELNPTFPERKRGSRRPTPKYTKVGERLRHVIPGHMACSMACGGRACKYENPARWSEQEQAIKGVYSSWVTDNILAMARPSTEVIEKYNIIEQFQSSGIKTVINLQRPGEHASCGNPLEQESGFTYLPEAFMEAGIYFYNFGWKDYGVASLTTILDMVKVMTFALQEGRLAIHCHAGLGRTAVTTPFENQDAVFSIEREYDPLWKRRNVECLQPLTHLKRRLSYSDSDLKRAEFLLEQGETPWTVPAQILFCRNLKQQKSMSHCYVPQSPQLDLSKEDLVRNTFSFWNQAKFSGMEGPKGNGSPVFHRRKVLKEVQRSRTFSTGFSGAHNSKELETSKIASVHDKEPSRLPQKVNDRKCESGGKEGRGLVNCAGNFCGAQDHAASPKAEFYVGCESQESKDASETIPHIVLQSELSIEARRVLAAKALANINEFVEEEEVKQKVEMWQKELNSRDGAWEKICGERDPFILCSLMWSWVEQLKEPIITKDDIDMLASRCTDTREALSFLEKGQHQTILCILHCVVNLRAIPVEVEEAFLVRAIKAFTKISFDSENGPMVYQTLKKVFKHTLEEKRKVSKEGSENPS